MLNRKITIENYFKRIKASHSSENIEGIKELKECLKQLQKRYPYGNWSRAVKYKIFYQMNTFLLLPTIFLLTSSCKMITGSDTQFVTIDNGKVYRLRFNPVVGAEYHYDMVNKTAIKMEINDTEVDNVNTTTIGVTYAIEKDSIGGFVLNMSYDKINISSKTPDTESEMDADNASLTNNMMEKMLGLLKTANISIIVAPDGNVKSITGYKELTDKVMAQFEKADPYTRAAAQKQWNQFAEKGIVSSNLEQMLKIFPDSAVHIKDRWKLDIAQNEELGLVAKSTFQLIDIEDHLATIVSSGDIGSDGKSVDLMGQTVIVNLKGHQTGDYKIDVESGMLLKCDIQAQVDGAITVMGKERAIKIETSFQLVGKGRK
jgi:hypothetical protein